MSDEIAINDAAHGDFDPNEMSEEVAEQAKREARDERDTPLDEPYDDEDAGDPMREVKERPPPPPPKTYKAKANGKDFEVPAEHVDALAEKLGIAPEDLLRGTQMLRAGQDRLREAAEKEKQAQTIQRAIREGSTGQLSRDTRRALKDAGIKEEEIYGFALKQVQELMEIERLEKENPDELERRRTQARLEELKEQEQRTEQQIYQARAEEKLSQEIKSVLEGNKLP
jgi:hypothetical protein